LSNIEPPPSPKTGQNGEDEQLEKLTRAAETCLTAVLGKLAYRAFVKYMRDRYGRGLDILPIDPDSFEEALSIVFRKSAPVIEEVLVRTLKTEFDLDDSDGNLGLVISQIAKMKGQK